MEYDLVFEGGGAKGIAFVGALQAFERHGHIPCRLIGSSARAITACLIAAGYTSQENLDAIAEKMEDGTPRFASFMDTPTLYDDEAVRDRLGYWLKTELDNPLIPNYIEPVVDKMVENLVGAEFVRHLISLLMYGGWYAGDLFLEWLREKLDAKGENLSTSTLAEFAAHTGRDLSVVASDLTGKEMLVLNHRTAPDLPTVWAVRMSMSLPFAWSEVSWKAEWGKYRGRDLTDHRVVDGGMLSNFPIQFFISDDENIDEIMGEDSTSENVIGFLIDETIPVPGIPEEDDDGRGTPGILEKIELLDAMTRRIRGLTDTVLSAHDKSILSAYSALVCRLPAKGVGTLEFDMSTERRDAVVQAGDDAMEAFLAAKNNQTTS